MLEGCPEYPKSLQKILEVSKISYNILECFGISPEGSESFKNIFVYHLELALRYTMCERTR